MTVVLIILTIVTTGLLIAWIYETVQSDKEHAVLRKDIDQLQQDQNYTESLRTLANASTFVTNALKTKPDDVKVSIEMNPIGRGQMAYVGEVEKCGIKIRSTERESAELALRDAIHKAQQSGIDWRNEQQNPVIVRSYSQPAEVTEWPVPIYPTFLSNVSQ